MMVRKSSLNLALHHLEQALTLLKLEDQKVTPTTQGFRIVGPDFREETITVGPPWHLDIQIVFPAEWQPSIDRSERPQIPLANIYSLEGKLIFALSYRARSRRVFFDFGPFGQVLSNIRFAQVEIEGGTLQVTTDIPGNLIKLSSEHGSEDLRAGWSGVHGLPLIPAKLHLGMKERKNSWVPPNGLEVRFDVQGEAG